MFVIKNKQRDVYLTKIVIDARDSNFQYYWCINKEDAIKFVSFSLAYKFVDLLSKAFLKSIDIVRGD